VRRSVVTLTVLALLTVGCGGGGDAAGTTTTTLVSPDTSEAPLPLETSSTTTTTAVDPSAEFVLTEADNGAVLRLNMGDTIIVRLTLGDPGEQPWIIAREPDPSVLSTGETFVWVPSEPGQGNEYVEFSFQVIGPGTTSVMFSEGPLTPTTRTVSFDVEATA
jgi:hypothetical protein